MPANLNFTIKNDAELFRIWNSTTHNVQDFLNSQKEIISKTKSVYRNWIINYFQ